MKKLLPFVKYLSLLEPLEGVVHDAYTIYQDIQAGRLDDAATIEAATDLGKRLLKLVGWVESHGASAPAVAAS